MTPIQGKLRQHWLVIPTGLLLVLGVIYARGLTGTFIYDLHVYGTQNRLTSLFEAIPAVELVLATVIVVSALYDKNRAKIGCFGIVISLISCPFFSCMVYGNFVVNHRISSEPLTHHLSDVKLRGIEYRLAYHTTSAWCAYYAVLYRCDSLEFACYRIYTSPELDLREYRPDAWVLTADPEEQTISVLYNLLPYHVYEVEYSP